MCGPRPAFSRERQSLIHSYKTNQNKNHLWGHQCSTALLLRQFNFQRNYKKESEHSKQFSKALWSACRCSSVVELLPTTPEALNSSNGTREKKEREKESPVSPSLDLPENTKVISSGFLHCDCFIVQLVLSSLNVYLFDIIVNDLQHQYEVSLENSLPGPVHKVGQPIQSRTEQTSRQQTPLPKEPPPPRSAVLFHWRLT